MSSPMPNRSRSAGFTMVEALVALVVLSIGLLGVAGLQLAGLRANSSAASRTQASYLADDILDRMRANRSAALAGNYNLLITAATPAAVDGPTTDLNAWRADLTSLPAGVGGVTVDPATGLATVSVQWVDSRGGDTSLCVGANLNVCAPLTFTTATQL